MKFAMPPPVPLGGPQLAQFRAQTANALKRIQSVERVIYADADAAPKPVKNKKA